MEEPVNCKCDEVVELGSMNTCKKCDELLCTDCCQEAWELCENCKEDTVECNECGDRIDKDDIGNKGRCSMCIETIID